VFDARSGLLEISEATVPAPSNLLSEFIVTYRDPVTDKPRKVRAHNIAALQSNGGVANTQSREYIGIPTSELAQRVVQRDVRASSSRLRRFSLTLDRRAWSLYPADVIRIRDVARGIPDMAVRIGRFEDGTFDSSKIKITAVQDVFALPATSFTGSQPPGWTAPNNNPCIGRHAAFELPYALAMRVLTPAEFSALTGSGALFGVVCEEGKILNTTFGVALKSGAPATNENPPDGSYYCPTLPFN
jgi:hypothetical protein